MPDPRFPIGPFQMPDDFGPGEAAAAIDAITVFPDTLRAALAGLDADQLDTPYRAGGWTLRQVVHHIADSHMNSYVRVRLTLTEDNPTIRPYDEAAWAELIDARTGDVADSLALIEALHTRWVQLLASLRPADLQRPYTHPDSGAHTLAHSLAFYAWHGAHHVAHITQLRSERGW